MRHLKIRWYSVEQEAAGVCQPQAPTAGAHSEGCISPVAPKWDVEIREGDTEK